MYSKNQIHPLDFLKTLLQTFKLFYAALHMCFDTSRYSSCQRTVPTNGNSSWKSCGFESCLVHNKNTIGEKDNGRALRGASSPDKN